MKKKDWLILLMVCLIVWGSCRRDDDELFNRDDDHFPGTASIEPNDFLSSSEFDKLIVEIQYVEGYAPAPSAVSDLKNFLDSRLNKPAGISIIQSSIASPGKEIYSVQDIRSIERANRTLKPDGRTLTCYFLFLDGDYAGNSGNGQVLGIAYGPTSMALFKKTIHDHTGGLGQASAAAVERIVLKHEFAHTLGLVNNGTSMQQPHQDGTHGQHCSNKNCLMYYTAETSDVLANILGGSVPELDDACIAGLKASGGK